MITRRLYLGTARQQYVRLNNCGWPGGWRWSIPHTYRRGMFQLDWAAPTDFVRETDLWSAVRTRLAMAGLHLLHHDPLTPGDTPVPYPCPSNPSPL